MGADRVAHRLGDRPGDYALLVALCASVFLSCSLASVLAPILPDRLDAMRCPAALKGAIFGAYPLTVAAGSLCVPALSARVGRRRVLVVGVVAEAAFVMAFGVAHALLRHDGVTLAAYLLLRVAQGAGEAAQSTAMLAYAADAFGPRHLLGTAMGLQETAAGLGFVLGPALGGTLADAAGFPAPFLLIGVATLALLPLLPWALAHAAPPHTAHAAATDAHAHTHAALPQPRAPPHWRVLAASFDVRNAGAATMLVGAAFGCIVPTLAPHLANTLDLRSASKVGLAYIVPAAVYGAACPLLGGVADRLGYRRVMRHGLCVLALAFVMMGPLPPLAALLGLRHARPGGARTWAWALAAMTAFGVGGAGAFVPTMPAMERAAVAVAGPAASETVASFYWTLYFFGEGLGPFIGTGLVRAFGPGWGFSVVGVVLAAFAAAAHHAASKALPEPSAAAEEKDGVELLPRGEGAHDAAAPAEGEQQTAAEEDRAPLLMTP